MHLIHRLSLDKLSHGGGNLPTHRASPSRFLPFAVLLMGKAYPSVTPLWQSMTAHPSSNKEVNMVSGTAGGRTSGTSRKVGTKRVMNNESWSQHRHPFTKLNKQKSAGTCAWPVFARPANWFGRIPLFPTRTLSAEASVRSSVRATEPCSLLSTIHINKTVICSRLPSSPCHRHTPSTNPR